MPITYAQDGTGGLPSTLRRPTVRKTVSPSGDPLASVGLAAPAPTGFKPIELSNAYGTIDKYFKDPLKGLGYSGSILQANPAFYSAGGDGGPTPDATVITPGFAEWAAANGVTADLLRGSDSNTIRLLQNGNPFAEKTYTTKNGLDKFVEVLGPIALAIGTGGVLGQALGMVPAALNPIDPATWGAAAGGSGAAASGAGTGAGGGAIAAGGAQGAAALEAAVAADLAAAQAAAAGSVGAGAGLTAAELAALGVGGAGAAGTGAGLATLPAQATGAIAPTAPQTLPMTAGVGAVPPLAGPTGTSAIDKVLGAITTAGGNLVNKAIENPLQTAALVGSVGALAGAKPSGVSSFDAEGAAAAQGAANRDASWFDAVLNRPDMQTPWGSSTWTLREGADPKNPKPGDWVNTVALNTEQQALLDAQNRLSAGYASTAEGMLGRVQDTYGQPFDLSSLPGLPDFGTLNSDLDRKRVEDALLARLEPQLQQEEERARTRLLNTGFEYGSEGSNIELDRLARGRNDARLAAVLAAGDESSRLMGDQRANLLAQLQARQQGFQEQSYQRALPLNELNAFRQGTQVQAPEFQSIIPTNTAASPEFDALLAKLGIQQNAAANKQSGYNALLSAIGGLGAAWLGS